MYSTQAWGSVVRESGCGQVMASDRKITISARGWEVEHLRSTPHSKIALPSENAVILLLSMIILLPLLGMKLSKVVDEVLDASIRRPSVLKAIPELDPLQLGYLARGRKGVIETVLAKLVLRGDLEVNIDHGLLMIPVNQLPTGLSRLEKQVLIGVRQCPNLSKLYGNEGICRDIKKSLIDLRLQPQGCWALYTCYALFATALPLGFVALAGVSWFPQIALLFCITGLLFVQLAIGSITLLPRLRRTQWGDYVVKHYREQHNTCEEMVGVALDGHVQMCRSKSLEDLGRVCEKYYRDHVWDYPPPLKRLRP